MEKKNFFCAAISKSTFSRRFNLIRFDSTNVKIEGENQKSPTSKKLSPEAFRSCSPLALVRRAEEEKKMPES